MAAFCRAEGDEASSTDTKGPGGGVCFALTGVRKGLTTVPSRSGRVRGCCA